MTRKQEEILKKLWASLINFDVETVKTEVLKAIQMRISAEKIIQVMTEGMATIGKKYKDGEYFVSELIIAGETMKEAIEVLKPFMGKEISSRLETVVVATVAGDIHDIGKNIFVTLMTTAGFKVIDIGVDVSVEKIIETVKKVNARILGLSALLTTNLEQFPIIIEELKKEKLRDKIKVIIGGATVTEEFAKKVEVDGYAKSALDGVEICKAWAEEYAS